MKYEKYLSLIKRLEDYAARNPQSYRKRIVALGLLGYGYFLFVATASLAVPLGMIGLFAVYPKLLLFLLKGILIKLLWVIVVFGAGLVAFFWSAIRSLFVKLPAPEGAELKREDAPKLFEMVEKTGAELKSPMPSHVLLNDEFNASVVSLPKFGVFGRETYLNVGLPLMQALSPAQFHAVIAHEMGHLSENHGKDAAWIYRLHESWGRFLAIQEQRGQKLSFLYERFLNWYFPYFSAYAFVLRREHEREADRSAVRLAGAQSVGEAFLNLELKAARLKNEFWREILDEAAVSPKPPQAIFSRMATTFRQSKESANEILHLTKALAIRTDYEDPHPCLADRLREIGYWRDGGNSQNGEHFELPVLPGDVKESAAEHFLGAAQIERFTVELDREWQRQIAPDWKARHEFLLQAEKRLAELEAKNSEGEQLSFDELYERAQLTAEKRGNESALPLLFEIAEKFPENGATHFTIGAILLEDGDEKGIEHLKKAIQLEPESEISACEQIFRFLLSRGREEEAKVYLDRAEQLYEIYDAATKERETVTDRDRFELHSMPPEAVERVSEVVSWNDEIKAAYLVRKQVKHLPEHPCHVLCLEVKTNWNPFGARVSEADLLDAVIKQVAEVGVHFGLVLNKNFESTKVQVKKINGAKIYPV